MQRYARAARRIPPKAGADPADAEMMPALFMHQPRTRQMKMAAELGASQRESSRAPSMKSLGRRGEARAEGRAHDGDAHQLAPIYRFLADPVEAHPLSSVLLEHKENADPGSSRSGPRLRPVRSGNGRFRRA